jgi:hypothetical protein
MVRQARGRLKTFSACDRITQPSAWSLDRADYQPKLFKRLKLVYNDSSDRSENKGRLRDKPMLAPSPAFLRHAAKLHRIHRLRPLHHHALEEVGTQRAVRPTQPLVERERIRV